MYNQPMRKQHTLTAIIYDRKGNVLSIGQNSYIKTHPLQKKYAEEVGEVHKEFLHAEIHAITKVRDLSKAHQISIFRYGADGEPRLAKPCRICQQAILASGIKVVKHT